MFIPQISRFGEVKLKFNQPVIGPSIIEINQSSPSVNKGILRRLASDSNDNTEDENQIVIVYLDIPASTEDMNEDVDMLKMLNFDW